MAKVRVDRTSIFLGVVVVLFFWDLIYFLGITDPAHFPHPFRIFRLIGDFELFRGFRTMLRQIIIMFVPGFLIGAAVGHFMIPSSRSHALLRFLRLGLWLPFLLMTPFIVRTPRRLWVFNLFLLFGWLDVSRFGRFRARQVCRERDIPAGFTF